MGTITGTALSDNAAGLVNDVARTRWTDADWLVWLNDGQRQMCMLDPSIFVVNSSVILTPNSTRQALPQSATQFMSATRNMGADGNTPGRAVRIVSRDVMDAQVPDWHSKPAGTIGPTNYMYDPRDRKNFYVYPQAPATDWYLELVYGDSPSGLTDLADPIQVDDNYANAVLNYMLYRAYSRDNVDGAVTPASDKYYTLFVQSLGMDRQSEAGWNPNLLTGVYAPDAPAAMAKPR